jgi:hypothetical protein
LWSRFAGRGLKKGQNGKLLVPANVTQTFPTITR